MRKRGGTIGGGRLARVGVLALVLGGCFDDKAVVAPQSDGTLAVAVFGINASASTGGSVLVRSATDAGQSAIRTDVLPNGSAQLTVPAGTYDVIYTAPSGYDAVSALRTTTSVWGRDVGTARFYVREVRGELVIFVNTSGSSLPAEAGVARAVRTDVAGQTPQEVAIPNTFDGYFTVIDPLPAGVYDVTFTPTKGFMVPSAGAGASATLRAVAVGLHATTLVTFDIVPEGK
jgi:hypothetical protein